MVRTAGAAFIAHAKVLVQGEDRALRALSDYASGIAGRLRVSYLTLGISVSRRISSLSFAADTRRSSSR